MRKPSILLLIISTLFFLAFSKVMEAQLHKPEQQQQQQKPDLSKESFWDRVYFGGYLGLQFGTVTFIDIAPLATYQVTKEFFVGLGPVYQFYSDTRYDPHYNSSSYGAQFYARYHIWKDLFAQVEYDPLYITNIYDPTFNKKLSVWVHDVMVGGGYRQWLGNKAFATFMILFNVNESYYSPYQNPIIRIGFGVGL